MRARILNSEFLIFNFVLASISAAACRGAVPASVEAQAERIQSAPKKEPAAGLKPLTQGGLEVTQTFEIHPSEGPIGTLVELRVTGFGWRTMDSTWVVNWDNQEVGYVSATDTRGTAVARFRATGPVGGHEIKVYTGYMGQSYLNHEQAPSPYLPRPRFVFHVTSGKAAAGGFVEPYAPQKVPAAEISLTGAALRLTPTQGPVR